jgi:hypothetical protein
MSTPMSQTIMQFGRVPRNDFAPSCNPGDWQPIDITFPQPFPSGIHISVIATANDFLVGDLTRNEPVVGVVEDLTPVGCRLWGRYPLECASSAAGFNWLAVAETPGSERPPSVAVRLGLEPPAYFFNRCNSSDNAWSVSIGPRRQIGDPDQPPIVLATVTNLNIWAQVMQTHKSGEPSRATVFQHLEPAAVVVAVQTPSPGGFVLKGQNAGSWPSAAACFHAAFAPTRQTQPELFIETGRVGAKRFENADQAGDWQFWQVAFQDPFLTPPTVLVTANGLMEDGTPVPDHGGGVARAVAAVGVAHNVTTHGFTLLARNSDCGDGFAGFSWAAFGCERFCA